MLDLKKLRETPEVYKAGVAAKSPKAAELIDLTTALRQARTHRHKGQDEGSDEIKRQAGKSFHHLFPFGGVVRPGNSQLLIFRSDRCSDRISCHLSFIDQPTWLCDMRR